MKYLSIGPNDADEFDKIVDKENAFVKFYHPNCGHCTAMAPAWKNLKNELASQDVNVIEVHGEATSNIKSACAKNIPGFPTIMMVKSGGAVDKEYNGDRSTEDMAKFVKENMIGQKGGTRRGGTRRGGTRRGGTRRGGTRRGGTRRGGRRRGGRRRGGTRRGGTRRGGEEVLPTDKLINKEKYPLYKNSFKSATNYQLDKFLELLSTFLNNNKNKKIKVKNLIDEFIEYISKKKLNTDPELKPNKEQLEYIKKLDFKTRDNQIGGVVLGQPFELNNLFEAEVDMRTLQRELQLEQNNRAPTIQQIRAQWAEAEAEGRAEGEQMNFYLTIAAILFVGFIMMIEGYHAVFEGARRGGTRRGGTRRGGSDGSEDEYSATLVGPPVNIKSDNIDNWWNKQTPEYRRWYEQEWRQNRSQAIEEWRNTTSLMRYNNLISENPFGGDGIWQMHRANDGTFFYYNPSRRVSQWEPPFELVAVPDPFEYFPPYPGDSEGPRRTDN